jgi:hypothetical protein
VKSFGKAVAAVCVLALTCGVVSAQSLADVARKEQERRKTVKAPSRVYTNDDLYKYPAPPPAAPEAKTAENQPSTDSAPPATAKPELAEKPATVAEKPAAVADPRVKDELYWRGRITEARDALDRSEMFRDALQSRINALTTDVVNRDDPAQQAALAFDRQKSLAELDRVQADIQKQTQQIAAIEEAARRAGVPPGWLR